MMIDDVFIGSVGLASKDWEVVVERGVKENDQRAPKDPHIIQGFIEITAELPKKCQLTRNLFANVGPQYADSQKQ